MKLKELLKSITEKEYRILEHPDSMGEIKFYPQYRTKYFYVWQKIVIPGYTTSRIEEDSLEKAQKALMNVIEIERERKRKKTKVHEFNEVFHKLKSK